MSKKKPPELRFTLPEQPVLWTSEDFGWAFPVPIYRARCLRVVDGDTADLLIDQGLRAYRKERVRFARIDTPELNDRNEAERAKAQLAREAVFRLLLNQQRWARPLGVEHGAIEWPILITNMVKPGSFGRYLAELWVRIHSDLVVRKGELRPVKRQEPLTVNVSTYLLKMRLAKLYKRKRDAK